MNDRHFVIIYKLNNRICGNFGDGKQGKEYPKYLNTLLVSEAQQSKQTTSTARKSCMTKASKRTYKYGKQWATKLPEKNALPGFNKTPSLQLIEVDARRQLTSIQCDKVITRVQQS